MNNGWMVIDPDGLLENGGMYRDEEDRRFFLKTLSEACGMTGWRIHAWVLIGNHYHLLMETPEAICGKWRLRN